ncbi:type II toxin-antitoxin system VapC family toxin [Agaribacter flavus]|uniref:Type II toxin-antitoxin system VapC family toxin n=1 Tax=Agaribacter flavus TaxID=1902781 RepID=A0ABV7FK62_9ALTE
MRNLLLDTHAFLWWLNGDNQLSNYAIELISDEANKVYVSAATSWEISIKRNKGLLEAPEDIDAVIEKVGFSKLPISVFHGQQAGSLPNHHKDPFDRMLIAQAQAEGLEIITCDSFFPMYGVRLIKANV